jgi:hypothetical protein
MPVLVHNISHLKLIVNRKAQDKEKQSKNTTQYVLDTTIKVL